jgi:hypothetical protein
VNNYKQHFEIKLLHCDCILGEMKESKSVSSSACLVDSNSIHRRHIQSALAEHGHEPITSVAHVNPLGTILPTGEVKLKRQLGLFSGVCFIIGIIIGKLSNFISHVSIMIISSY